MSIGRGFLLLKLYYHPFLCNKRLEALLSGLASFPFTKVLKPYQSLQQTEPCIHHYSFSYLDFGLADTEDVPALLEEYVYYFNNKRRSAALGYKSPVQYKTELGF